MRVFNLSFKYEGKYETTSLYTQEKTVKGSPRMTAGQQAERATMQAGGGEVRRRVEGPCFLCKSFLVVYLA